MLLDILNILLFDVTIGEEKEQYQQIFLDDDCNSVELGAAFKGILSTINYSNKELEPAFVEYNMWNNESNKLTNSHIFVIKELGTNVNVLNVIFTRRDLELSIFKTRGELKFVVDAYDSVINRIIGEHKNKVNIKEEILTEFNKYRGITSKFYHWQIFGEKSLSTDSEPYNLQPRITLALFLKLKLHQYQYYCPKCSKMYNFSERSVNDLCECGNKIFYVPPASNIESLALSFNESVSDIYEQIGQSPKSLVNLVINALLPHPLILALDSVVPGSFSHFYPIPVFAQYILNKTHDTIEVSAKVFKNGKELLLIALIGDTRISASNLAPMSLANNIFRSIENEFDADRTVADLLAFTELKDWKTTQFFEPNFITNVQSLLKLL